MKKYLLSLIAALLFVSPVFAYQPPAGSLGNLQYNAGNKQWGGLADGTMGYCLTSQGSGQPPQWAICGSSGVTWPTTNDIVISNGTSSPAGLAPVNGDCVTGSAGNWVAGPCGSGTVSSGTAGQLGYYSSSGTTISPTGTNLQFDGNNLTLGTDTTSTGALTINDNSSASVVINSSSTINAALTLNDTTGHSVSFFSGGSGTTPGLFGVYDNTVPGFMYGATTGHFALTSSQVYGWTGGTSAGSALDTGISRQSSGIIDVGNGTQGDTSGTINAAGYEAGGTVGVTCSGTPTSSFATKNGIVTHC